MSAKTSPLVMFVEWKIYSPWANQSYFRLGLCSEELRKHRQEQPISAAQYCLLHASEKKVECSEGEDVPDKSGGA